MTEKQEDNYKTWYDEAIEAANSAGCGPCSAAEAIEILSADVADLRKQIAYWERGTEVIKQCLDEAVKADPLDAPFPFVGIEAKRWHAFRAEAFRHALEMMGAPSCFEMKVAA